MNGTFIESQTVDAFFHVFNFVLLIFALYDNSWTLPRVPLHSIPTHVSE